MCFNVIQTRDIQDLLDKWVSQGSQDFLVQRVSPKTGKCAVLLQYLYYYYYSYCIIQ